MMTQGVMTQAVNLFGNATGSVTLKGKQGNSSFDRMIDSTMKSGSGIANNSQDTEAKKVSSQSKVNGNKEQSDAVDGSTNQTDDTKQVSGQTENIKAAKQADNQTQKAEETKQTEDPTIDEATLEKITGLLQALQQSVMEVLNLTAEELNKLLSEQGLELADLLQPENLQQLVLADSGTSSILSVLTDENLSETMNQLLQAVEDIVTDANLGMSPEQIKNILDQAKLLQESNQVTSQDNTTLEEGNKNQESVQEAAINTQNAGQDEKNTGTTKGDESKNIQVEVMKVTDSSESSSGTQAELSNKDNREMTSAEQFEVFLNNLSKATTSNQVDFNGNMVQVTEIREIANQIIERIRVTIRPDQSSMELQLNPEHLGKVNLSVQSKNGVMTAQFVVQNEISREAIESQLHTLKETLNQQGIKVEAIEVTVAAYSFEQNSQDKADGQSEAKKGNSNNRLSLDEAISMTEDIEDGTSQDITDIRGSQIDYSA